MSRGPTPRHPDRVGSCPVPTVLGPTIVADRLPGPIGDHTMDRRITPDRERAASAAVAGIEDSAEGRLRSSPYLALRDVGCAARDGVVTLRGHLPTYYLKQLAQAVVAEVDGVRAVDNQIAVLAPPPREAAGRGAGFPRGGDGGKDRTASPMGEDGIRSNDPTPG